MYNSQMNSKKIILPKCKVEKTPYDLPNPEEEERKQERTKPSVERRKLASEIKYNQFVKDLHKKQKKKDLK
jgi:hypothetical protein